MSLSERIIQLRNANEFSQEQLAEKLGVTQQTISKWESGQANPDFEKLIQLSDMFNVSIDYLLKPSDINVIALKTELLENNQYEINKQRKKDNNKFLLHLCISIYLIATGVFFIAHSALMQFAPITMISIYVIATGIIVVANSIYRIIEKRCR